MGGDGCVGQVHYGNHFTMQVYVKHPVVYLRHIQCQFVHYTSVKLEKKIHRLNMQFYTKHFILIIHVRQGRGSQKTPLLIKLIRALIPIITRQQLSKYSWVHQLSFICLITFFIIPSLYHFILSPWSKFPVFSPKHSH